MKDWMQISQRLIMLGQLGLSLLISRLGIGLWIYFPGFLFGLGGSFMTGYKFWQSVINKDKKEEDAPPAFNSHH